MEKFKLVFMGAVLALLFATALSSCGTFSVVAYSRWQAEKAMSHSSNPR